MILKGRLCGLFLFPQRAPEIDPPVPDLPGLCLTCGMPIRKDSIPPVREFIGYLKYEKRYSAHTVRAYEDDLDRFFQYLRETFQWEEAALTSISSSLVRSWLAALKEEKLSARSINRKISSLKSFFKYHLRKGDIERSPMGQVTAPRVKKRLPVYVEQKDTQKLLHDIPFSEGWKGETERLILYILYATGMRLSELVHLRERQVDHAKKTLKILGKGNKERVIPVPSELLALIGQYSARKRTELENADAEFLLVNEKGKKLYPKYVYRVVKERLGQATTIEKKSPHVLRHSFATHLTNNGAELNSVKELLGHASLAATQVYTHNSIEKLKEAYKKAHPKA